MALYTLGMRNSGKSLIVFDGFLVDENLPKQQSKRALQKSRKQQALSGLLVGDDTPAKVGAFNDDEDGVFFASSRRASNPLVFFGEDGNASTLAGTRKGPMWTRLFAWLKGLQAVLRRGLGR